VRHGREEEEDDEGPRRAWLQKLIEPIENVFFSFRITDVWLAFSAICGKAKVVL
jgi:hypothetical protein